MKYFVTIGATTREVTIDGEQVTVDGEVFQAHLSPVPGTPLRHLLLGHASYTLTFDRLDRGQWAVGFHGERLLMEVVDERTRHIQSLTGAAQAQEPGGALRAPMPGLVTRVQVEAGQTVAVGQPVVTLEAMKMENELRSPAAGVVRAILVNPGQAVEKGAVLVQFGALHP